ncbi:solute carrier family 2, facilitated glucose transporter member 8 [Rhipicephalus microplus]|uniref:solute carrier family 2, facilitated glucose transporter member 8 n=1 Tax=Rhipicephalus microplus TaxID=6941 RepID=UPI003F6B5BC8
MRFHSTRVHATLAERLCDDVGTRERDGRSNGVAENGGDCSAMVVGMTAPFLTQRFGRRWSFVTSSLGLLATWLCIGLGHDVRLFFVARFANGFFTGFVSLVVPAHIAEMSLAAHRGTDGATHHLIITLGMLYAHTAGLFLDWSRLALCCAPPALLLLLLTGGLLVESPRWLLCGHRRQRALEALLSVRSSRFRAAAEAEFEAIAAIFPNYKTSPAHYMLAVLVMGAQQFSGINCVLLSSTSLVVTQEYMHTLSLLALIQFLVASLVVPFLDLAGRRKLLLLSTMVCSGSLITLGLVYYPSTPTVTNDIETTTLHVSQSVVPVATASTAHQPNGATFALQIVWERHLVLVFPSVQAFLVAGYSAGLGPVPWILAVELTPLRGDGMELGSVYAASWTAFFVTANYYSTTSTLQWLVITLWVYSCLTLTSGFLFLVLLPETAHASIEDVLLMGHGVKVGQTTVQLPVCLVPFSFTFSG